MDTILNSPLASPDMSADVDMPDAVEPDAPKAPKEDNSVRLLRKQYEATKAELEGYKRRDEEARKAKMSEEQRIKEEVEQMKAERDQLRVENLRRKVGAEYKLPEPLLARLVGSDEDSLRADAEELANLLPKPKVGTVTEPVRESGGGKRQYKESQITDRAFFLANQTDILAAMREGRIQRD